MIEQWVAELKERFPDQTHTINESRKKADLALDEIVQLSSNGVQFQLPEREDTHTQIIVVGDNNVINMPPIEPRSLSVGRPTVNAEDADR